MSMTVTYTNFGGQLVHENRGGVETSFVPDTLGSVMMCRDSNGNTTYEAEYRPYGEVRTETGTNPSPWGFVGTLGYYTDEKSKSLYVRTRTYLPNYARWAAVDPLWPLTPPSAFRDARPTGLRRGKPGATKKTGCKVYACYRNNVLHHAVMCVEGPYGGCSGDAMPGWPMSTNAHHRNLGNACLDGLGDDFTCIVISSDCDYASAMCECLKTMHHLYWLQGFCWGYVERLKCCACYAWAGKAQYSQLFCDCVEEHCPSNQFSTPGGYGGGILGPPPGSLFLPAPNPHYAA